MTQKDNKDKGEKSSQDPTPREIRQVRKMTGEEDKGVYKRPNGSVRLPGSGLRF